MKVYGNRLENAVKQMETVMADHRVIGGALMADHHLGYSMPIGGVVKYKNAISPAAVGGDIGCGNTAFMIDADSLDVSKNIETIMNDVVKKVSFGLGGSGHHNNFRDVFDDVMFPDPAWDILEDRNVGNGKNLIDLAINQLGTVGSGNHYVDIFTDQHKTVWVAVHFGSRGFGHTIASYFLKEGGASNDMNSAPVVFDLDSQIGQDYFACMNLAQRYAKLGRHIVCGIVTNDILKSSMHQVVDNHHNAAWIENGGNEVIVRKGATPISTRACSFIGATMTECSYIVQATKDSPESFNSAPHGAGRVLSRTAASGKKKWRKKKKNSGCSGDVDKWTIPGDDNCTKGLISRKQMDLSVKEAGVCLRGADVDESMFCYKRLDEVLGFHSDYIETVFTLKPIGVAMAGDDIYDPYKD